MQNDNGPFVPKESNIDDVARSVVCCVAESVLLIRSTELFLKKFANYWAKSIPVMDSYDCRIFFPFRVK